MVNPNMPQMSKLLDQLISECENREQRGLRKYGTSMDRTDLSFDEWLQHFKEELLDGLVYLQKIQNGFCFGDISDQMTWITFSPWHYIIFYFFTAYFFNCFYNIKNTITNS